MGAEVQALFSTGPGLQDFESQSLSKGVQATRRRGLKPLVPPAVERESLEKASLALLIEMEAPPPLSPIKLEIF